MKLIPFSEMNEQEGTNDIINLSVFFTDGRHQIRNVPKKWMRIRNRNQHFNV